MFGDLIKGVADITSNVVKGATKLTVDSLNIATSTVEIFGDTLDKISSSSLKEAEKICRRFERSEITQVVAMSLLLALATS